LIKRYYLARQEDTVSFDKEYKVAAVKFVLDDEMDVEP
jgi:hypothetical protein